MFTALALIGTALGVGAVVDTLPVWSKWPLSLMSSGSSGPSGSTGPLSIDQALVIGAGIGAAAVCPWLWFIATLSVLEALRGRISAPPGWTRRLTLLACGVAVTTSVLSPAHASTEHAQPGDSAQSISLDGLPYPDRASTEKRTHETRADDLPLQVSTPAAATPGGTTEPGSAPGSTHRVREGDTLWAIAAASTTGTDLPRAVAELHLKNRRVIGTDPDLIHPGQVLDLHTEGDEVR